MKSFQLHPVVQLVESVQDFCEQYQFGTEDLIFISASLQDRAFAGVFSQAIVIDYRRYGSGEPTDTMVEGICRELGLRSIKRVFGIGGGSVLDIAKLFALKKILPLTDLFTGSLKPEKEKQLILVPTTCGTGSEVTNISILEFSQQQTKLGLADDSLYADEAVLLPALLAGLPFEFFATSSLDALVHAVESYTSPRATAVSKLFSLQALDIILQGYKKIAVGGTVVRSEVLEEFLRASTYAGIAFGNAGCAAVHALSYPLGAMHHVPHGEANYAMFAGVYKMYQQCDLGRNGSLQDLEQHIAGIFSCRPEQALDEMFALLAHILPLRRLRDYGVTEQELEEYTDIVIQKQGRLMGNNYAELSPRAVRKIYQSLF